MWIAVFMQSLQKEHKACNFIKKETLAQVFSCEFCEISKNTFSYRTTLVAGLDDKIIHRLTKNVLSFSPENNTVTQKETL